MPTTPARIARTFFACLAWAACLSSAWAQTLDFANAPYRRTLPALGNTASAGFSAARDPSSGHFVEVTACYVALQPGACATKVNAATGATIWTQYLAWPHEGVASVMALDSSGNVFVAMRCGAAGGNGYCLARLASATGAVEWTATIDEPDYNLGQARVTVDPSGNPVVAGTCHTGSSPEPCVAKFNGTTGATLWSRRLAWGDMWELSRVRSVLADASGNVLVAGDCDLGSEFFSSPNACLEKLAAATGNTLWQANYDPTGPSPATADRFQDLALFANGDVAAAGDCGSETCTYRIAGGTGAVLWQARSTGVSSGATRVRVDSGGHVVTLAGCSGANAGNLCFERRDASNGNVLWSASYTSAGSLTDTPADLAVGSGGALFVAATCSQDFATGASTVCTLRLDGSTGAVAWTGVFSVPPGQYQGGVTVVTDASGNPATFGRCSPDGVPVPCAVKYLASGPTVQWSRSAATTQFSRTSLGPWSFSISEGGAGRNGGFLYTGLKCGDDGLDLCVLKTNETTGASAWVAVHAGAGTEPRVESAAIVFSPAGEPIVAGTCSADTTPATHNLCAKKLSPATGAAIWTGTYPSPGGGFAQGRAAAVDASGDVYVTGTCRNAAGNDDICTVKFSGATGALQWVQHRNGTQNAGDDAVAVALSGTTVISTGRCANTGAGDDICTTAYAASTGTELWRDSYNGPAGLADRPVAMAMGTGVAYIAGRCAAGTHDNFCTLKYDVATGARQWAAAYAAPGNTDDKPAAIAVGPDGHPVVTGTCYPIAGDPRFGDLCTVKHASSTGGTLWSRIFVTGFSNVARDLAIDAIGNVLVAGDCAPDLTGRVDLCLLKLAAATGVQRSLYTLPTGDGGVGSARRVFTSGNAVFVAADWTPRFQATGTRFLRFTSDATSPTVNGIALASPNFTSSASLSFGVTFSESVTGVDAADFVLATTGTVAGATITGVTGSGATRTVTINRGTGSGSIRLDVLDNDTIVDAASNPLNGVGTGTAFAAGPLFTVFDPVRLVTTTLPSLAVGTPVNTTLVAADGLPPYAFGVAAASLPTGLALDPDTGAITGTPTAAGAFLFQLGVSDDSGAFDTNAFNVTVAQGTQAIAFAQLPDRALGTGPFALAATGGGSGLPVTFASLTPAVCTATGTNGATLTLVAAGTCTIRSSQAGNANWTAAPNVDRSFAVAVALFNLTVAKTGLGTVTSSPAGIACGATCSVDFASGAVITLGQVAAPGYVFSGWSGACTGSGACQVTMSAARNVTAAFVPVTYALTVTKAGTGQGGVLSSPAGIDCGAACVAQFANGTVVTLAASPTGGSTFTGWSGACTGTGACQVTLDAAKAVSATFAAPTTFALTVSNPQAQRGTVFSNPDGIACGVTCTANYDAGVIVTLTASPSPDFFFAGWSGACTGTGACNVTMDAAKSVSAEFKPTSAIPRLANISTRMQVLTGADVLIGGFIIGGSQPKTVVVRARGPSLIPLGVPNALANPVLQLFSGATQIDANDNWQQAANQATIQSSGFAPSDPLESAIYTTLNPGAYTAIVTGANLGTGVAIIEVFEVDKPEVPLLNIATRGKVLTGGDVMIGGFIIQGDAPQTVVVRARGPSLTAAGVPGALQDTVLQLFSGPTVIASNDDWQTSPDAATIQSAGFAPSDTRESVIRITLNPGAYTAIVTGKNGTTGVGIIEVFAQ